MKIVKEPLSPPHQCAVIPGRGASSEKEGFIDTGNDLPMIDPHVYVSIHAAREMGLLIGMHTAKEYESLQAQLEDALAQIDGLEGEKETLTSALDAVEALEARGYVARGHQQKAGVEA